MEYRKEDFDLAQTLECGQCFRWNRQEDGSYRGIVSGRCLTISESNIGQVLSDPFWRNYFDFTLDYGKIRTEFAAFDSVLAKAAEFAPGMRILNQEPWEALASFILSQNNNIKRIKGIVARLCEAFGDETGGVRTFPDAKTLAALKEDDLGVIRSGFRAKYLLDAARRTASGEIDFQELRQLPLGEAREKLTAISGVGPKVADCVLLYGLHRLEAFPMDVWMKRAMATLFPGKDPAYFGPYAGIAQQYIFHYSRNNPQLFLESEKLCG